MTSTTKNADEATTVEEVASKAVSGMATFAQLKAKPKRTLNFTVMVAGDDGEPLEVGMKFQAIPSTAYDRLVESCPPTPKDKQRGSAYNLDTFAPKLIAAVSLEPALSVEQATELYNDPDWSGGEISTLFINAQRVCNSGLDIPFNARD